MKRLFSRLIGVHAFEAMRYREYRLLCYGQFMGTLGNWMDEVARGWLIYELTDSAVQLGLVRGIQVIPFLVLLPVAGSVADRYSRKTQVIIAQMLHVLVHAATAILIFTDQIQPWHVYLTAFLAASAQVFQQPSRAAMVSDAVPREYLTNAIGISSLIFNLGRVLGPVIAGVLIVASGTGGAYAVQALAMALATLWTLQLRPSRQPERPARRESFARSILEGWTFSWRCEPVRAGLLCTMIAAFFMYSFTTLLPVFARDLLGIGVTGQGLLLTAMGGGALVSAFIVTTAGHRLPRGLMMMGGATLYGLVVVVFAASTSFHLSLAAMAIAGLCQVYCNALVQTVVQSYSPPEFRGRTLALFSMNQVLGTAGSMVIGFLAALLGPQWAAAVMGVAGVLAMALMYVALPGARKIR